MQVFKRRPLSFYIYIIYLVLLITNCNQISEGLQRRKFEFLYKLNNYASLLREYTSGITYYKDLDFYEGRINKLYEDVNKMSTIDNWGNSRILKENFMNTIEDNIKTLNVLRQRQLSLKGNIRKEYDVIIMNERVENFLKELEEEISKVGKE